MPIILYIWEKLEASIEARSFYYYMCGYNNLFVTPLLCVVYNLATLLLTEHPFCNLARNNTSNISR